MYVVSTLPQIEPSTILKVVGSLKALAHPIRLSMVELLKDGQQKNVTEIYEQLGLEQAVASQHLSILKEKDILTSERRGKQTFYSVKHACAVEIIDLVLGIHTQKAT